MKKRSLVAVLIFSVITVGIYDLVWLYKIKKELNQKTSIHIPSIFLLFVPIVLILIAFVAMFALAGSSTTTSSTSSISSYGSNSFNTTSSSSGSVLGPVVGMLIYAIAILAWLGIGFYWFLRFSKGIDRYTEGKISTPLSFLLLWVLNIIGIMLLQDYFNDMLDGNMDAQPALASQPTPMPPVNTQPPTISMPPQPQIQPNLVTPAVVSSSDNLAPMSPTNAPAPSPTFSPTNDSNLASPANATTPNQINGQQPIIGQGPLVQ